MTTEAHMTSRLLAVCALVATLLFPTLGWAEEKADKKEAATNPPAANAPKKAEGKASRVPTKPKEEPFRVTGSWIVISHAESKRGLPSGKSRTKEDARKRAEEALAKARDPNTDFKDVVTEYSDDLQGKTRGGAIGQMLNARVNPEFQPLADALFGMEVGQVSEIVESPMGFHILMRTPVFSAAHILISYKGSARAKPDVTRTKEEAEKLATELTEKAKADGADFAALAKEHSNGPSGPDGGDLGTFPSGQMVPAFEEALNTLEVGGVVGPVQTQFGFHVIKRTPIVYLRASHILVVFKDSPAALPDTTRTKDEAKAIAEKLYTDAIAEGADFAELAKNHSDGPTKVDGGDLGRFQYKDMVPAFAEVAFALKVGEISKPVETQFGFHVIKRTE